MSIICFEGASAVGKTTTANALQISCGAFIVPEVNSLFDRPKNAPVQWYFERQVERWSIAKEQSRSHHLVILDGDPFQPLWYCWAYNFVGWPSLDFMEQFYQPRIQHETLGTPDLYFVFRASEAKLRKRKVNDLSRKRRGFETHLKMIEPQSRYFREMQVFSPNQVCFLNAETIETNIKFVHERILSSAEHDKAEPGVLCNKMIQWLRENKA